MPFKPYDFALIFPLISLFFSISFKKLTPLLMSYTKEKVYKELASYLSKIFKILKYRRKKIKEEMEKTKCEFGDYSDVLKEDFFSTTYLDRFRINGAYKLSPISVVIPTFNRCPHPAKEDSNPLGWCLESLLAQQKSGIDEIVIVDDDSKDYTEEVVKDFSKKSPIQIIYLKNGINVGSSISRNRGVKKSKNNLILFLDDDCVFSKYMTFGANYLLNTLGEDAAALHLPIYHRKTVPTIIKKEKIGKIDIVNGIMLGNLDGFPVEYARDMEHSFLDPNLKILKPFEINNLGGVFVIKKDAFEKIGGFPEFFTWKNGYREETEVSLRLANRGYRMFFTPDPKFYCVHLKYGANGKNNQKAIKDAALNNLVKQSDASKTDTGNRVNSKEWFSNIITSTMVVLGLRNQEAAKRYLDRTYQDFVIKNELKTTGVGGTINDLEKRRIIFEEAKNQGAELIGASR